MVWIICLAIGWLDPGNAFCEEPSDPLVVHITYGQLTVPNDDPAVGGGDYTLNLFGADVQKTFHSGSLLYGYEVGIFFSIDSEVRSFYASSGQGGGKAAVSVDVNSFLIDYFMGGFVGLAPAKWLRVYAGAGPLIIWGMRDTKPVATPLEESEKQSDSGLGVGAYARAGVDIFFSKSFGINAGARVNQTTLSFKNMDGDVDVEGWQYYCGATFYF